MQTLDYIAINSLENIDRIIEYSPYSTDIKLKRNDVDGQFGYEIETKIDDVNTVGLIIYNPEKSFLKNLGVDLEEGIPIIGLFKDRDKFKKNDYVIQYLKDFIDGQEQQIEREFQIVDILFSGDIRPVKKVFKLAPIRGEGV